MFTILSKPFQKKIYNFLKASNKTVIVDKQIDDLNGNVRELKVRHKEHKLSMMNLW